MKKKIKIVKWYKEDELLVDIINDMKTGSSVKKVKQPRLTLEGLAIEMRAGFAAINARLDKHEEILMRHEQILMRHEEIFKRNKLK